MKTSGLLKWLTIPVVLLAVFVCLRLFSNAGDQTAAPSTVDVADRTLTPEESKALGVEADSPRDTVATLVGEVKQLRSELKGALEENAKQKAANDSFRLRDSTIDQRIQNALRAERERWTREGETAAGEQRDTQGVIESLQRRLDDLNKPGRGDAELPVGLGLDGSDAMPADPNRVRWVEPQDAGPGERKPKPSARASSVSDTKFPVRFEEATSRIEDTAYAVAEKESSLRGADVTPVYTVPSNATLMGSIAMTALIGRVPIDGSVNDPYPFKVVIGGDNLTANGIEVPELAGAIVSGTASGDWTLSCVRGQIRSMTFVFHDGTVRTVPSSSFGQTEQRSATAEGSLGWISDPYGIPCVSGERRSNAQQYLTSQMLITAAGAGAASLIESDTGNISYVSGSNGTTLGTVGITGNEAMGRILAGGVQEMSQWVGKLYGQAFAAVYVAPGAQVAVHIEQPLEIDFDARGRKVNHQQGTPHVPHLD